MDYPIKFKVGDTVYWVGCGPRGDTPDYSIKPKYETVITGVNETGIVISGWCEIGTKNGIGKTTYTYQSPLIGCLATKKDLEPKKLLESWTLHGPKDSIKL